MLVQCPKCKTTYKVADELLKGVAPAFRCSRCKHTFDIDWQAPLFPVPDKGPSTGDPGANTEEDRELSFDFPPKEKTEKLKHDPTVSSDVAQTQSPPAIASSASSDRWSMTGGAPTHEEPFTISQAHDPAREEKFIDAREPAQADDRVFPPAVSRQENGDNILPLNTYRSQQVSSLPFLTVLGLLVMLFSLLTAFQRVKPKVAEVWLRNIPLVGAAILKNNHLKSGVLLKSLRANYQTIQGNRDVIFITGIALNENPVIIREVRVMGQIYNQEGKEIEQQTIWLGNAISPKLVRGMTAQEISNLQKLKSLKTFDIPPGDSVSFTIVFLKASKGVKDFTCEIVSAQSAL